MSDIAILILIVKYSNIITQSYTRDRCLVLRTEKPEIQKVLSESEHISFDSRLKDKAIDTFRQVGNNWTVLYYKLYL